MAIERARRKPVEIPTASMSDIAFLLLIFFMSTTKFDMKQGLGMVLPRSVADEQKSNKATVAPELRFDVNINAQGKIQVSTMLDGAKFVEVIPMSQLQFIVKKKLRQNAETTVKLATSRQAKYDYMIQALEQIQLAGAESIMLYQL